MDRRPVLRFAPDLRLTALAAFGAVIAAVTAAVTTDVAGRLLSGAAALLLFAYVVGDLVFRPRLVVDAHGVRIRSPLARVDIPWSQVDAVRADTRLRFGLRSTTLEVDAGATLVVLSRRALGADPQRVAELAAAFER